MNSFNHTRPRRAPDGSVIGELPAPVFRATAGELGGQFGRDKRRRLVVGLEAGDIVSFRPHGTRQRVTALAVDLFRAAIQWRANKKALERARERKALLATRRERRRIAAADRRLSKPLEA